jgi:regulator of protease activity HflC (stomatin/prohibitin superfamily)
MFLIILGVILFFVAPLLTRSNPSTYRLGRIGRIAGIGLVIVGVLTSCFVQIQPGQVGVQKLFGKIQPGILTEGLNVINPLIEVVDFDVRTQNYTMSAVQEEGEKMSDDAIQVLSADGLEVTLDLTILYRVLTDKAPELLRTVGRGYRDVLVRPITRTKIRDFAAYYDAVSLYSVKRDEFQQRLFNAIDTEFQTRGLVIEQVLIRNINLPASVKQAIESKINAEQESQKMKFVLDKERQEADRKRVEAQGISDYQRILTSTLTDKLLQYEQIQTQRNLANSPNSKVIFMNGNRTPVILGQ